jgi:hypothetical protein
MADESKKTMVVANKRCCCSRFVGRGEMFEEREKSFFSPLF